MKSVFIFAALVLAGAGCAQPSPVEYQPVTAPTTQTSPTQPPSTKEGDNYVSIKWFYDAFLSEVCLDGGDQEIGATVAAKIGYPNKTTDHLCVTENTAKLLSSNPEAVGSGSSQVILGKLQLLSNEQGRIYSIDVLKVK